MTVTNKEIEKVQWEWVSALQGDKYVQGQGALRVKDENGDSYCCLGVLCDIVDSSRWGTTELREGDVRTTVLYGDVNDEESSIIYLSPDLEKYLPNGLRQKVLSNLNDVAEFNFKQIAEVIRAHIAAANE